MPEFRLCKHRPCWSTRAKWACHLLAPAVCGVVAAGYFVSCKQADGDGERHYEEIMEPWPTRTILTTPNTLSGWPLGPAPMNLLILHFLDFGDVNRTHG